MENRRFPLFIDLTGRKAVVVGGGAVGLRRAKALRRYGAEVTVVSPDLAGDAGEAIQPWRPVRSVPGGGRYQPATSQRRCRP